MPHTITDNSIVFVFQGKTYTVPSDLSDFAKIAHLLTDGDYAEAARLADQPTRMQEWAEGEFIVKEGKITYRGEALPSGMATKIWQFFREGNEAFKALLNFWARLSANPSYRSVNQLYGFIGKAHLPISPDGYAYAYKSVRHDFLDHHSGTIDNSPGKEITFPRNKISDDPNDACSVGIHAGSWTYARGFHSGSPIVIVRYDPADVVCVPHDANQGKMRLCRYDVVGISSIKPLPSLVWDHTVDEEGCLAQTVKTPPRKDVAPPSPDVEQDDEDFEDDDSYAYADDEGVEDEDSDYGDFDYEDEDSYDEPTPAPAPKPAAKPVQQGAAALGGDDLEGLDRYQLREIAKPFKVSGYSKLGIVGLKALIREQRAKARK